MDRPALDVVALGSAIVDVLATSTDAEVEAHGLVKGTMALIDADQAETLYASLGPAVEMSGGAAANTVAGVASFGGRAAFIGKVRDDQLGRVFTHDIRAVGVEYTTAPAPDGPPTGRSLIMVTPDGERTMNTFLGAAVELTADDVDADLVGTAAVAYLEGYLWDPPDAIDALRKAVEIAGGAGRTVALSLSDPLCVGRHRDEFAALIESDVDVVFANEAEVTLLTGASSFDEAAVAIGGTCEVAALTRGADGAAVVHRGERIDVPAVAVTRVVDTTGAGDLFAAGFLYGYTHDLAPRRCAELGALAAAEVISHVGGRPQLPLSALLG